MLIWRKCILVSCKASWVFPMESFFKLMRVKICHISLIGFSFLKQKMGWEICIDLLRLVHCNITFIFNVLHLWKYINEFSITHLRIFQAFIWDAQQSFRFQVIFCIWTLYWLSCISEFWLLGSATKFGIFSYYLMYKWLGPLLVNTKHFFLSTVTFYSIKFLLFPST